MASEDSKLIVDTIKYSQKQLDAIEKKKEKELDVYRKKVVDNWNDQRQRTIGDKKEHDRQWKEDAALLVAADKRDKDRDARESAAKMKERAAEERNAQLLEGLTGFAKMRELGRQKAEKLKKAAAGKVKDWGVKKLAQVKEGALKLLDMLKKGLGLAALWALFWFIKNQPWKSLSEEVKKNIQIITDGIMGISGWLGIAQFKKWLSSSKEGANVGKKLSKVGQWFKNSWIGRLLDKIKLFFSSKGSGGKATAKIVGLFSKIGAFFSKAPMIGRVLGFIKGAAKLLGKIFLPFTVLMSLWEAVTGFMDAFSAEKGNTGQKIIAGIGGAIKSLLDFFIFGIADMVQEAIIWLLELFGFDSAATAVGDFNLVGMIRDAVFAAIDFVTDMWKWVAGGFAGDSPFKGLMSWFDENVWQPVVGFFTSMWTWASEGIAAGWNGLVGYISGVWNSVKDWFLEIFSFAKGEDTDDSDDGFLMSTIKKVITSIKAWFSKMFDFGSAEGILKSVINVMTWLPNIIKDAIAAVTEWLLGLFGFDDAAKAVADANKFSIGDMVMNAIKGVVEWLEKLFDIDIGAILSNVMGALGDAGKKVLGWLGFGDDKEGKQAAMGGPIGKGEPVLVGEHGPELFVPSASGKILPKMQTESAMGGGGAPMIINAPTTSNVSNGTQTVSIASSSVNPMNDKYFRN